MSAQASFALRGRNPDVLTCIANLSNDEVFTPPEFANRMLDTLADAWAANNGGASIWADKTVKFLDPCTKSGVFLREITSRLTKGLEKKIPDVEKRVNHILTQQVFGIGITQLTSLLARRSDASGLELLVQLKASSRPAEGDNETITLRTATYNYLWDKLQVVMLVKYVEAVNEAYWLLLSEVPGTVWSEPQK
jgi:hypothetical protein